MKPTQLALISLGMIVGGVLFLSLFAKKSVTLSIDGDRRTLSTSAWTVGGFIRSIHLPLYAGDQLFHSPDQWLLGGETVTIQRASDIRIEADGKAISLRSTERLPGNLIAQAGVPLFPGDQIISNGRIIPPDRPLSAAPNYSLQLRRKWPVTLTLHNQVRRFSTNASTLGEALWEQGIIIHPNDQLIPPPDTPITAPLEVSLQKSKLIEIRFSGGSIKTRSTAETVGEILSQAGMPLQGLDYSVPDASAPLLPDSRIRVVHVQESTILETEPLAFDTEIQPADDLELDQQEIIQNGTYGLNARRIRLRLEDGQEVSRQVEEEYIAIEPQPKIVGFGTKIVPHTLDTPAGPIKYWRALNMYAVSYNPTSAGDSTTATGATLQKGIAAVDISIIPFGTQMYVPGYGVALAADTGGGVKGRLIDLGYSDHDYVSWHQWVTVYFLWPPPANIVWVIP